MDAGPPQVDVAQIILVNSRMLDMLLAVFPDLRLEAEQILASGDHVISRVRFTATHQGNYPGNAPTYRNAP